MALWMVSLFYAEQLILQNFSNKKNIGTIQIPVDSSEETPGGGRMVI